MLLIALVKKFDAQSENKVAENYSQTSGDDAHEFDNVRPIVSVHDQRETEIQPRQFTYTTHIYPFYSLLDEGSLSRSSCTIIDKSDLSYRSAGRH